jgi:hypothetical protein
VGDDIDLVEVDAVGRTDLLLAAEHSELGVAPGEIQDPRIGHALPVGLIAQRQQGGTIAGHVRDVGGWRLSAVHGNGNDHAIEAAEGRHLADRRRADLPIGDNVLARSLLSHLHPASLIGEPRQRTQSDEQHAQGNRPRVEFADHRATIPGCLRIACRTAW